MIGMTRKHLLVLVLAVATAFPVFASSLPEEKDKLRFYRRRNGSLHTHRRQHGFQVDDQQPEQVDAHATDILYLLLASCFFCQYPGLVVVNILIGKICKSHNLADGTAKLTRFIMNGNAVTGIGIDLGR